MQFENILDNKASLIFLAENDTDIEEESFEES